MHQAFCHTFLLSVFNLGGTQISILYCISMPNMYCASLPMLFILLLAKTFCYTLWKWQSIIMKFLCVLNRIWNVFFKYSLCLKIFPSFSWHHTVCSFLLIFSFSPIDKLFILNLLCRHHNLFRIILRLLVWVWYSSTYLPIYLNNLTYFFQIQIPNMSLRLIYTIIYLIYPTG